MGDDASVAGGFAIANRSASEGAGSRGVYGNYVAKLSGEMRGVVCAKPTEPAVSSLFPRGIEVMLEERKGFQG